MALFEFTAEVTRIVDEEVSIILDGEDEEDARQKALELIEDADHSGDIMAKRYLVLRRRHHVPDDVKITLVEYEEPEPPRYA